MFVGEFCEDLEVKGFVREVIELWVALDSILLLEEFLEWDDGQSSRPCWGWVERLRTMWLDGQTISSKLDVESVK